MTDGSEKRQPILPDTMRSIALDFNVNVVAVAGSLRTTIPLQLAKELSIGRGDTLLMRLIQLGDEPEAAKAILVRKKS